MAEKPKSSLKYSDLIMRIEKGEIARIYFIDGEEELLQTELVTALRQALFGGKHQNVNLERFTASAGKAADLINSALEYSLFAGGRLIVVSDAQNYNAEDTKALLDFFPQIPPENHLVLFHKSSPDMRKNYYKYLTTNAMWVTLEPPTYATAKFWVKRRLKKYEVGIDDQALDLLLDYAGLSYSILAEELDKLSLNMNAGSVVNTGEIRSYGSRSAVFSVFELTDALGNREKERALDRLERLLEGGESVGSILWKIAGHFDRLIAISHYGRLMPENMIAGKLRVKPFFIQKCRQQIAKFSPRSLNKSLKYVFEAEYQTRFESMPTHYILEQLIIRIVDLQE